MEELKAHGVTAEEDELKSNSDNDIPKTNTTDDASELVIPPAPRLKYNIEVIIARPMKSPKLDDEQVFLLPSAWNSANVTSDLELESELPNNK